MNYQTKLIKNKSEGFTLVELLIVISIAALLINISTSAYTGFKARENLNITTTGVVEAIRYAQADTQSGKGDSKWGVKIFEDSVVIFKGPNYTGRDISADKTFDFFGGVTASGLSEIVFEKVTGSTGDTGTIVLTNSYGNKNILINEKGTLIY